MSNCPGHSRHWFTVYGAVGAGRALCGHCQAIHPDIAEALQRGLYYLRLYSPPDDATDYERTVKEMARDLHLLESAINRVANEPDSTDAGHVAAPPEPQEPT